MSSAYQFFQPLPGDFSSALQAWLIRAFSAGVFPNIPLYPQPSYPFYQPQFMESVILILQQQLNAILDDPYMASTYLPSIQALITGLDNVNTGLQAEKVRLEQQKQGLEQQATTMQASGPESGVISPEDIRQLQSKMLDAQLDFLNGQDNLIQEYKALAHKIQTSLEQSASSNPMDGETFNPS